MQIQIYQPKETCPFLFMPYTYAEKKRESLWRNYYTLVWEGNTEFQTLEEIFMEFNFHRPSDFKGHSLSVSDIVKTPDGYFYVNSIGFKKIDNF